jgi:TRAP-type mannitol/chloroaromatic compound transport system substrate-binding protein
MGGWFNKEINTIQDIQGLKMRIPGFGGKVFAKAGGTAVTVPGGELYTNLERGVIDATEWIGPYHDYLMGFHQVAQYYYYPGWHEPGTILELIVNKEKFEALPTDLQQIVRTACYRVNHWMWTEFDAQNGYYLKKLRDEENVEFRAFPTPVLEELRTKTIEVIEEIKTQDPLAIKIADAYTKFKNSIQGWSAVSDQYYYSTMK